MNLLPESATQTRSRVHRLEHTWTIDYFSYHCDDVLHREDYLQSSKFSPFKFNQERLQFFLRVHPRGDVEKAEETKDNVPIYLHIQSNKSQIVSAKVSLVKASGEKCNTKEDTKELSNNAFLGWHDFVRRDYLLNKNNGLLSDDQLAIYCEIVIQVAEDHLENKFTDNKLVKADKAGKQMPQSKSLNSYSQSWTKTCLKIDKFSHVWTVDNFSNLNLTGEFPSICSSYFHSHENPKYTFTLQLYPKGDIAESKDYISIHLFGCRKKLYVKFAISLLDNKGQDYQKPYGKFIFSDSGYGYGWTMYISRANLFASSKKLLPNDKLTFSCEISNLLGIETTSSSLAVIKENNLICQTQLAVDLGNLLKNCVQNDITFVIGDSKFPAHKSILAARSPVFAKMFEHDFEENQTKQVTIVDIEADVFEQFMKFVYTGKVVGLSQLDERLLIVSDKYQMDSLKRICEASLSSKLCPETVIDIIAFADMHDAKQLKTDSIEYIKSEGSSIVKLPNFKDLLKSYPDLAYEVICSLVEYLEV